MTPASSPSPAWQAAEAAARESYGRLLAWLAVQWRDVEAAEDALGEAFVAALRTWPRDGVPAAPDAWLLTAARRQLQQAHRHRKVVAAHAQGWLDGHDDAIEAEPAGIPDERLALLFVCAHPALDAGVRTALMLQTVLGVEAADIASAFLVSPAAMAQRLVRAKRKLRDAGARFEAPEPEQLGERVHAVLEAVYAAYGLGWEAVGVDEAPRALSGEAVYLARVTAGLLPDEPEALGLLALMLFCEARADARHDGDGGFVPLHAQDTGRWRRALIDEAEQALWRAAALRRPGPFQLEAAIQSAHCQRLHGGAPPWPAIASLYDRLLALAPTIGAAVAAAVATAEAEGADAGLARLDTLAGARTQAYQPYWAARAHLLAAAGCRRDALEAYGRAIGLAVSPSVKRYLQARAAALSGG